MAQNEAYNREIEELLTQKRNVVSENTQTFKEYESLQLVVNSSLKYNCIEVEGIERDINQAQSTYDNIYGSRYPHSADTIQTIRNQLQNIYPNEIKKLKYRICSKKVQISRIIQEISNSGNRVDIDLQLAVEQETKVLAYQANLLQLKLTNLQRSQDQ